MFDQFSDQTLPRQGERGLRVRFFDNVGLCLVPNLQINTKTDLNP